MKEPASFDLEDAEKYSTEWICIKCAFGELLRQACQHIRELKLTVAQLQAERNAAKVIETAMATALQSVSEKARGYKEALAWYADEGNIDDYYGHGHDRREPDGTGTWISDHGDRARKALGGEDDSSR